MAKTASPASAFFRFIHFRICFLERKQAKNFYVAGRSLPRFAWRKPPARRPRFLDLSILESANLLFGKKAGKELLLRAPRFRRGTPVEFAHAPPALLAL
jgi:hypothetical protein